MTRWQMNRRSWLRGLTGAGALFGLDALLTAERTDAAAIGPNDRIKVTKVEAFVLKNSWVFVKVSTDAGISGWGEMLKDDAKACAAGALEVGDYLVGQDPCRVVHHWQAIHRGAFYRGGPHQDRDYQRHRSGAVGTSRARFTACPCTSCSAGRPATASAFTARSTKKTGVNAMKTGPRGEERKAIKYIEGQKYVDEVVERFRALREKYGPEVDIGLDFHGAVQPPTALLLMKALEPYNPWFYEEIVQALNVDIMAELARKTHVPIATGERIFTKWGFKEILEKRAAAILQPDVCYAGGITELKIITGMAEAYYTPLAPHNPQGPCSLAASLQIAASIPNFLIQERGDNEYADLLAKPLPPVRNGHRPLLTAPGLGIAIDEDKLLAQVGEPREYRPQFDPDDGSVVDW